MHVAAQVSQHHLLKRLFLLHFMLVPPLSILINYRDLGLFLGSLFCSIGLYVCFHASTRLFDYSALLIHFDIKYCDPSCFVLLSQNCCSYSGFFKIPYKFLKSLFYICEICHWSFDRDCMESINCFG